MEYKSKEKLLKTAFSYDTIMQQITTPTERSLNGINDGNIERLVDQAYESGKQEGLKEKQPKPDPFNGFKIGDKVIGKGLRHEGTYVINSLSLFEMPADIYSDIYFHMSGIPIAECTNYMNGTSMKIAIDLLVKLPDSPEAEKSDPALSLKDIRNHIDTIYEELKAVNNFQTELDARMLRLELRLEKKKP